MLLPPTRFDPPLSLTFLHSRRTHPSHRPSTFCLFHYSHPSSWPLSLSAAFPSTKLQPLFSPPFVTIALLPPFRNALSDSALVWGVCERENQAGERLSALLPRRSLYIVLLQEECFFTSFFLEGSRVGIRRVREFGIPRQFAALRSTAVLALTRMIINISNVWKLLFYARFCESF